MKKTRFLKFLFIIIQVICLILIVNDITYAGLNEIYDPIDNPFSDSFSIIISVLQAVGMSVAVIMLTYIGIKYLMTSPEGKADLKQQLFPYLIGCVLLFGGSWLIATIARTAYNTFK